MGMKYKEVGGGPATGLGNDFVSFLQQALDTGSFGGATAGQRFGQASPIDSTRGISGYLNDLLSGGAGKIGGAYSDIIGKQADRDAMALRARFGAEGGTAFGTPAAYSEALLRSETAPKLVSAIGGLQGNAANSFLSMLGQFAGKGVTQREGVMQQNPWVSALGAASSIAGPLIGAFSGSGVNPGAQGGGGGGGLSALLSSGFNLGMQPQVQGGGGGSYYSQAPAPMAPMFGSVPYLPSPYAYR